MEKKTDIRMPGGPLTVFILGAAAGAVLFILTYGSAVLDVTYDTWIFRIKDVDIHQHYLGWCHFRKAPWHFPPGLFDSLSYPYEMSILWTDSIPLFALFFKCFRDFLPETFQYFGIYGLLSQMLTGALSALMIRKVTGNDILACISAPFFAGSFPMLQRMFYHTSLTSHYLIIIPLMFFLHDGYLWKTKKKCVFWGLYFLFSVMIHPYLWAMGAVISGFAFIYEITVTRDIRPAVFTLITSAAVTVLALCFMGALSGNVNMAYKLGGFGANLNTFVNPLGLGSFLPELPLYTPGQYEGFGYLGAGGLLLALSGGLLFLVRTKRNLSGRRSVFKDDKSIFLWIMGLFFLIMALFPVLSVNTKLLFELKLPDAVSSLLGIFRSNGRFIWPVVFLIYTGAIAVISERGNGEKRKVRAIASAVLLTACLCAQFWDMEPEMTERREKFSEENMPWHSDLDNRALFHEPGKYKHIVLVTTDSYIMERSANFAALNGLTVNRYYFARDVEKEIKEKLEEYHELCRRGEAPEDTIFVFDEETMEEWRDSGLHFYDLTGTIVGIPGEIEWEEI